MSTSISSANVAAASVAKADVNPADFVFDGGDVEITLKDKEKVFTGRVCSQSMSLASPVWKKFIFPPGKGFARAGGAVVGVEGGGNDGEGTAGNKEGGNGNGEGGFSGLGKRKRSEEEDWDPKIIATIDFSEDDCVVLLILLNIAHVRLTRIPKLLDAETLSTLGLLCEQYQCIEITAPWATDGAWFSDLEQLESENKVAMLWAYWAFGKQDCFARIIIGWSQHSTTEPGEDLVDSDGRWMHPHTPLPPGTLDCILTGSTKLFEDLVEVPYTLLEDFASAHSRPLGPNHYICSLPHCEAMLYGSLLIGLQHKSLWPRELATDLKISPVELAREIRSIFPLHYPLVPDEHGNTTSHVRCMTKCSFGTDLDRALRKMPSPLLDSQKRHMETQTKALEQG